MGKVWTLLSVSPFGVLTHLLVLMVIVIEKEDIFPNFLYFFLVIWPLTHFKVSPPSMEEQWSHLYTAALSGEGNVDLGELYISD